MEGNPPGRDDDERTLRPVGTPAEGHGIDSERAFWRQFAEATTPKAFCQSWLPLQCRLLKGVRCAMVLLGNPDRGPFTPVAVWPDAKLSMDHLTGAAEQALKERRGLLLEAQSTSDPETLVPETYHVAYPIEVSNKIHGVVVLEVEQHPRHEVQAIMRQLHWGAAWLEVLVRRTEASQSAVANERLQNVLDLVTSTVEHQGFHASAMAFVTRLATVLECDRVSLGFMRRGHVRVKVLSHSAEFGKQTNLMRAIGSAMDEAIDQHAAVVYPSPADAAPLVTRAHEELSRQHGAGTILTIPLESQDRFFGGLTLERPADRPFDKNTVAACETAAVLAGPILDAKRAEDRWLIRKAADSFARQLQRLLGPGYLVRKLILLLILALVVFFAYFEVDYRVTAPTAIEGAVQRVVAAPFDGYIKEAAIRPGDMVKEGDLLCLLDDRDLKLERIKWLTEREQLIKQYHEAMAKHDRAEIRITKAKIDQAKAQLSLIDEQLARTKVVAPFNGIVMSGDLSQSLGAPVERGQVLFEVAPLDAYRVIAEVDERDITEIALGQQSELILPSMPGQSFPFVVEKVTPVSTAKEGRNYFRVEGSMEQAPARLRPGMEGVGKIKIDRRKLIWVWTHKAIDWLRLQLWRWIP
jgi:RND family efflux transporter MFP subunit